VVGSARNAKMSVATASASATFTAAEMVVETVLGGKAFKLGNFSGSINLATIGAGGMDAGSAPANGFVALYAIYNPTTGTSALLAKNAATLAAEVYSGANMPAGYIASALLSIWPTNASSQFKVGAQRGRTAYIQSTNVLTSTATIGSFTALSIASVIPLNATEVVGIFSATNATPNVMGVAVAGDANGVGYQNANISGTQITAPFRCVVLMAQNIYYQTSASAGAPTYGISISGYSF
jgi:hypothetical protein